MSEKESKDSIRTLALEHQDIENALGIPSQESRNLFLSTELREKIPLATLTQSQMKLVLFFQIKQLPTLTLESFGNTFCSYCEHPLHLLYLDLSLSLCAGTAAAPISVVVFPACRTDKPAFVNILSGSLRSFVFPM